MMCSSWKISVFGILALMLAFGMTSAIAQSPDDYGDITLVVSATASTGDDGEAISDFADDAADVLRATEELKAADGIRAAIVFTFAFGVDELAKDDLEGTIEVKIPGDWTSPFEALTTGDNRPGAVFLSGILRPDTGADVTLGPSDLKDFDRGRLLTVNIPKGSYSSGEVILTYKSATVPNSAGPSKFGVQAKLNTDKAANLDPTLDAHMRGAGDDAVPVIEGAYYVLTIGSAPDGSGKVTVANSSLVKASDDPAAYKAQYFAEAKKSIGDIVFTYEVAGTMYKGARVQLEVVPDDTIQADKDWPVFQSNNVIVTGAKRIDVDSDNDTVIAEIEGTVKAGKKITFRYKGAIVPDITEFRTDTFTVKSSSPLVAMEPADTLGTAPDEDDHVADSPITVNLVGANNLGKLTASVAQATSEQKIPGDTLVLEYTAAAGMAEGAQVEVTVPAGWTPAPFTPFGTPGNAAGEVVLTATSASGTLIEDEDAPTLSILDRKLTATLRSPLDKEGEIGGKLVFTYHEAKAPKTLGASEFLVKAKSNKDGKLTTLKEAAPTIEVVAGHGTGKIALTHGGRPFRKAMKDTEYSRLVFTYTADERLAKGALIQIEVPSGWIDAEGLRANNKDGVDDLGEVTLTGAGSPSLSLDSHTMTATTGAVLSTGARVVFTLAKIKVPDVSPRSYEFPTHVLSFNTGEASDIDLPGAKLDPSPTVGIDQAADGSGTISITKGDAALIDPKAGESLGDLVFTYIAAGIMEVGSEVEIKIPDRWPAPIADDEDTISKPGEVSLVGVVADLGVSESDRTVTATLQVTLNDGDTFSITYKAIKAPLVGGTYTFNTKAKSSALGRPTALDSSPTVNVDEVAAGTIALTTATGPLTSPVAPGIDLGNLTFAFTADVQMANGAQVSIDIPAGWSVPFSDNNDGTPSEGEVSVTGKATLDPVSGGSAGPWTISATTNDIVESGDVITFTYKMVMSPGEGRSTFATKASVSAGGVPLAIADSPSVIVRRIVADVGIEAMPATVFTGDDITVTVTLLGSDGEAAKAFGAVSVMLSSSFATGVFSNAAGDPVTSVMIADNTSSWTGSYSDTASGTVMLTATATVGEAQLTDAASVTVKSTISALLVNDHDGSMEDPVPPLTGNASISVSAVGKKGVGTVKVTKTEPADAEGNVNVRTLVSLSLDSSAVDPDSPDGDYMYTRLGGIPLSVAAADAVDGVHNSQGVLLDGDYVVEVNIAGEPAVNRDQGTLNNLAPPTLSNASADAGRC